MRRVYTGSRRIHDAPPIVWHRHRDGVYVGTTTRSGLKYRVTRDDAAPIRRRWQLEREVPTAIGLWESVGGFPAKGLAYQWALKEVAAGA